MLKVEKVCLKQRKCVKSWESIRECAKSWKKYEGTLKVEKIWERVLIVAANDFL